MFIPAAEIDCGTKPLPDRPDHIRIVKRQNQPKNVHQRNRRKTDVCRDGHFRSFNGIEQQTISDSDDDGKQNADSDRHS